MIGRKIAVVTGASSGIGAATVGALAGAGFHVIAGARRLSRVQEIVEPHGGQAPPLDVTDGESVEAFAAAVPRVHLLVNNAGLALGVDPVATADLSLWERMYETNVLGILRMTRALLPALIASGDGHLMNVVSIAGFETYGGGGGYTASKHAVRALTRTLRLELLGKPVRVTEICPGLAETEFSLVRF
ncbi:MAG: SDR family NAD(P)-dependent oxidoreductase, partial [Acidobacteria bacterium]|nr:SDR family NAD(P)-dependent oxidoreductase [Acidobacteriota bacterium]